MKITSQTIPPELEALYKSQVTTIGTGPNAGNLAHTRTGARINPNKRKTVTRYNELIPPCSELVKRLGLTPGTKQYNKRVKIEVAAINQGTFNPTYWIECPILEIAYLKETPINAPDPAPPPYAYRDPLNMPTIATYTIGALDIGPESYIGTKKGTEFSDDSLTWSRTKYDLPEPMTNDRLTPAILVQNTDLTVATDKRGSRPTLSIIYRAYVCDPSSADFGTLESPATRMPISAPPNERGSNSLYWRYIIPGTAPPYYNTVRLRKILRNLNNISTMDEASERSIAIITTAPRPMFGRGFNNCETVNTSMQNDQKLYQLCPCAGQDSETIIDASFFTGAPSCSGRTPTLSTLSTYHYWDMNLYWSAINAQIPGLVLPSFYHFAASPPDRDYITICPGDPIPPGFVYAGSAFLQWSRYSTPGDMVDCLLNMAHNLPPGAAPPYDSIVAYVRFARPLCMPLRFVAMISNSSPI